MEDGKCREVLPVEADMIATFKMHSDGHMDLQWIWMNRTYESCVGR